jgi:hypothetical protein
MVGRYFEDRAILCSVHFKLRRHLYEVRTGRMHPSDGGYLEVRCLGCDTHQTVALDIVRRPKATPIHELERYMR